MNLRFQHDAGEIADLQVLWEDSQYALYRGRRLKQGGTSLESVLIAVPAAEQASPAILDRLVHEYGLKDELDATWAVRPLDLVRQGGRTLLLLDDPGGEPLEQLIGEPMDIEAFLRLAIDIAKVLSKTHSLGLIHKDVKPANIFVNCANGPVRLAGFGLASRLPRERRTPEPPDIIAGTLAYMAPEQTGRMNRSIDSRADLYALGVSFYRMLTGVLPFNAADPMEWVHCHIARKPVAASERCASIPVPVSDIVAKLLAKTAEERYQTAAGLGHDLRHCLNEWIRQSHIARFLLGERDAPDRLLIPEKLYGREHEVESLLGAFDRVVAGGGPELVVVAGQGGVGKSVLVAELHRALVPSRGLFASGKFDQLKRDIPYASLAQALQGLIRPLLGKSEADLAPWRAALVAALGPNGALMATLVPELEILIGPQPPAPELSPKDAQRRFQLALRRLLAAFARPEHPLALFLDDLQWLDAATLDVLEDLLTQPELQHLLVVGAYRDDEVTPAHPLMRRLAAIGGAGGRVREITLKPLGLEDVSRMVADALRSRPIQALARLVHAKTAGNPFFAIQFLTALAEEGLLAFDRGTASWRWDLKQIRAKDYTDNVADFMLRKLRRLPVATRTALQQLACLGSATPVATFALVRGDTEDAVNATVGPAIRARILFREGGAYRFLHDRVREAAYALIPDGERQAVHLAIGRRLLADGLPTSVEDGIFEIVGQLNRGSNLINADDERERLAGLNLIAGQRAKFSTAYSSALTYLVAGTALLPADAWRRRHDLAFALEVQRAECEFLTGALAEAEARLAGLADRAASPPELATVTRLRVDLFMTLDQSDRAIAVGLECLRRFGIGWSAHPTIKDVEDEYSELSRQLGGRPVEALLNLPSMADPIACAAIDVLTSLVTPALFTDEKLRCRIICRMGNLCLTHGNSDASCYVYAAVGNVVSLYFGNYELGFRFGELGVELAASPGMERLRARVYLAFSNLAKPSPRHFRNGCPVAQYTFEAAQQAGDVTYAVISRNNLVTQLLAAGAPLSDVEREAEAGLKFARGAGFGLVEALITAQIRFIRTLRGLSSSFGCFNENGFDERQFESQLEAQPSRGIAACTYWIRKLQARVLANDDAIALAAATSAERLLWMSPVIFERADYHLFAALALIGLWDFASVDQRSHYREKLAAHQRQLRVWAEHCPENFASRAALLDAEIAHLQDREIEAERLFEQAIRSARINDLVQEEALAYERAARFYAARDFGDIAHLYLRKARSCYLRWGAEGKARQLDDMHPQLSEQERAPGPTSTIGTRVEQLDLATITKVSQAVSGEMNLERLIDTLLRTAIEQAGAERGLLIFSQQDGPQLKASARTIGHSIIVEQREEPVSASMLPLSMLNHVVRTSEFIVLDDAEREAPFSADPYIVERRARSILCVPLLNRASFTGVLYLENNLSPGVFSPRHTAVLKLLASQAAIALENAVLYRDLEQREAKIRRLVDANIIGIFTWRLPQQDSQDFLLEANDAFLQMLGYDRDEFVSGRMRRYGLTPPEWRERDTQTLAELRQFGVCRPFEKEYFRKDGSRVPVLIGAASFDATRTEGVAFVVDLTERKRKEHELRASEERFRTLVRFSFDIYWEIDAQYRYVRREFPEGVAGEQPPIGTMPWETPYLEPDAEAWRKLREALDARLPVRDFEVARLTPGGVKRCISVSGLPAFDETGHFIGYRGVGRDITERKRAEEALRRSEAYLAEAQRLSNTGAYSFNATGSLYWSEELYRIWGFDPLQGIPSREIWQQRLHPDDRNRFLEKHQGGSRQNGGYAIDYRIVLPDGTIKHLRSIGHPSYSAAGELIEVVGTTIDITERKRAEAERERVRQLETDLAHLNRLGVMGELTASLAHEILHPIATARNNARAGMRFLEMKRPNLGEVMEALACVVRDADRAKDIVGRIRDHIKKSPPRKETFDLNEAIDEVIVMVRHAIDRNSVAVHTRLKEGLMSVDGDRVQLQQVVLNLILNAVEAMSAAGEGPRELSISTGPGDRGGILVAVADSGPGIDPQHLDQVFKPFHTTKPSGMGMGLSICQSIIAAHGGRLWAEANRPRGAIFQFTLLAGPDSP
ncbi:AAA family ATPase [Bradyrhizobium commune]|uniref:histidine kinase n=1 Tax=Bradyrhizobium commune TaxID=83627 RepID=A0A7S9D1B9_9BRAD|nr:AAA family ATPase [Bradyrhizobium commune]QPF88639.1 AAA family ATPase [Bradyrhizobium commune]